MNFSIFYALFSTIALHAEVIAPNFTVTIENQKSVIAVTALAPTKHHFNLKAPMRYSLDGVKKDPIESKELTDTKVKFTLPRMEGKTLTVFMFVCDDANTYCLDQKVETKILSQPKADNFILNQPEVALEEAKLNDRPLIIDFYGIWCPPCNQLDEEVFSTPEFQKESAKFIKLRLDADASLSWDLKSKYKVGGYPTIIFASSTGDELFRVVGYRTKNDFLGFLKTAWQQKDISLETLLAKASTGDQSASDKAGRIFFERADFEKAKSLLQNSLKNKKYFELAMIGDLQSKSNKNKDAMEQFIKDFPTSPESIEIRSKLADLQEPANKKEQAKLLNENIKLTDKLLNNPKLLKDTDYFVPDILQARAETFETLEKTQDAKKTWLRAVGAYQKRLKKKNDYKNRGINLEMAFCLWKSGDIGAAEKLYSKLEITYPQEFTFYAAHARMEKALGHLPRSQTLAEKALELSYGDNRLRVAKLVADIHKDEGHKVEALAVIRRTLAEAQLPADLSIRTHRYFDALKEMESSLQ